MTFSELLEKTRRLADAGFSWSDAWKLLEGDFRRLASPLEPLERLRAYESLLAAFTSDTDHPIEPPGSGLFVVPKAAYGVPIRRSG